MITLEVVTVGIYVHVPVGLVVLAEVFVCTSIDIVHSILLVEVPIWVRILAVLFESLLDLLVAILILNAFQCHLHHFWVDRLSWFSEFMIFMSKVAFFSECAYFV